MNARLADATTGPGLSVDSFFALVPDRDIRKLLDPEVLTVLDTLFGGRIEGETLRRVTSTIVDVSLMLGDPSGRSQILTLIPDYKRSELEDRVGRDPYSSDNWTTSEVNNLRDFFGLFEERNQPQPVPTIATVEPSYGLFDHQRRAVQSLIPLLTEGDRRAVLHLPTGVGKTRTAMHVASRILRSHEPTIIVWLASGKELLEQAATAFQLAWRNLGNRPVQLGTMWGHRTPDLDRFSDGFLAVGLAKGWSVLARTDPDWAVRLSHRVGLVVFDEAHQSIARTYRRITDDLTIDYRCSLLGLTATPGRTWNDIDKDGQLASYYAYNKVALEFEGDSTINYLTRSGYLSRTYFRTLFTNSGVRITRSELVRISKSLDIPSSILERLSKSEQYITAVLDAIFDLIDNGHIRIIVFAASVEHARILAAVLTARQVRSAVITGTTPERIRTRNIQAFKLDDNLPFVLINFGVLTTGFDAPKTTGIIVARPTKSLVLYSQMVGRGIRGPKAGGTESCEVVTVVDTGLPGFASIAEAFNNWEDIWQ